MPCWVTIRIYQEEFDDLPAMRKAAEAMGLRIEERGGELWIGGTIKVTQKNGKYVMSSRNETLNRSLLDEYSAARIQREASRRNLRTQKTKVQGKITLKVWQEA